jgi:hypothetical protein
LELTTFQGELRAFEARYLHIIGVRYAEIDELEAQIAESQARLQAISREWESAPEAVKREWVSAELVRTIRKIAQAEVRLR